jgi:hypothetical protein
MRAILERLGELAHILRTHADLRDETERFLGRDESQKRRGHTAREDAHFAQQKGCCGRIVRRFGKRREEPGNPQIVTGALRTND